MNITDKEYEEYQALKKMREWEEYCQNRDREYEMERERRYQRDVEHNIEIMRNNGTLLPGRM